MSVVVYKPVADFGLLVEFGTEVDDALHQQVLQLDAAIAGSEIVGIREVVPALVNLLIVFDPLQTDHTAVQQAVKGLFPLAALTSTDVQTHVIDVCYEDTCAPDLDAVAAQTGLSREDVAVQHSQSVLKVGMYGFAPGYAYLMGLPTSIQVPRKTEPLRDVPAGSVIIAGAQCLITTLVMPTGWSIIGRTSASILTGDEDKPFLFSVGDTVSFNRVPASALDDLS